MKTQAISKGLAEIIYKPEQAVTVIIQKAPKSQPLLLSCSIALVAIRSP